MVLDDKPCENWLPSKDDIRLWLAREKDKARELDTAENKTCYECLGSITSVITNKYGNNFCSEVCKEEYKEFAKGIQDTWTKFSA